MAFRKLTANEWHVEIERALEFRRQFGLEDSWPMLEALYSNVHESQANAGPNLIMSHGDTMVSGLCVPYPYISIMSRSMDLVDQVSVVENTDNMLVDALQIPKEFEPATLGAYLQGVGVLKIGYDSEFGWDTDYDIGTSKNPMGMSLTQYDKKANLIEFGNTTPGMPWVQYVPAQDFLVPWGTRSIDTAEYAIHRFSRHIDDLRADNKFENTKGLQPGLTAEDFHRSYTSTIRSSRVGTQIGTAIWDPGSRRGEYVECWEIHDRRTRRVYVVASGYDKLLRDEPDHLQVNGLPFVGFGFVPSTRSFWRTPDSYYLLQAQLELSDITIQNSKIRRARVMKMLFDKDKFDDEQLARLNSGKIGTAVPVKGDPSTAVAWAQGPSDQMPYMEAREVQTNARQLTGFGRNQIGEFEPGGRRTAFEVAQVAQGSDLRQNRRQAVIAQAYCDLFKKINGIIGRYWTTPRAVQVMDPLGQEQWKQVVGSQLRGDFGYRVAFSNEGPVNRQVSRQEAISLLGFLSQDPLADPAAVRRWLVRSINNPSFSAIYGRDVLTGQTNAPLQLQMPGVPPPGGQVSSGQSASPGPSMPKMQG